MVVAQKVKEAAITEQDSLLLTRNLLRIAIFNISYIRGLFPEKYFTDKNVPALEMKIKKLMPLDAESRRLIDWMEKGVYDALQKKYLKMLLFCVCEAIDGPMIEEYAFSFSYSDSDSQEVSMNFNRIGNKKKGGTFKCNSMTEITPNQMRSSACKMVRTLVQLMRTLDKMPEERTILMKLLYYDDGTPAEYEPPFFKVCSEEAHNPWTKSPLKIEVGNVDSKHFVLALKVKSVLDPCDDEYGDMEDNDESLGADSDGIYGSSDSDTEVNQSKEDRYIVAPAGKKQLETDTRMVNEGCKDDTQNPEEDGQELARVKEWIDSLHCDTIELTDILSNFTDISVVLTEEIIDKLVQEDVLSRAGEDVYIINKHRVSYYDFNTVKEERERQTIAFGEKTPRVDDHLYMKALYHVLPMTCVTTPQLQSKLGGEASLTTVRKLMNRMTKDGYLEAQGNRRLGKRVIHSMTMEKKLLEVKRALRNDTMDQRDNNSTCGVVQSVGSDLSRMKLASEINKKGSIRTDLVVWEPGNTPTSRAEPVASRESFTLGYGQEGHCLQMATEGTIVCSGATEDKKARKASRVEDPILHFKRQKSQPVL